MMIEFEFWWLLVIPLFFILGWVSARVDIKQIIAESTNLPASLFKALSYLNSNQNESAITELEKAVKLKNNSLEIHFALGSLLRREGKYDKAINLHIALLNKREITSEQEDSIKAELAQDYFKAGLYGRSESILKDLKNENYFQYSLNLLREIYVRERDWDKAIESASNLEKTSGVSFRIPISHYFCELATNNLMNKKYGMAKTYLKKSLEESKNCVRANILLGDIAHEEKKYDEAIIYWKKIEYQKPEYLGLVIQKIISAYEIQNNVNEALSILSRYYELYKLKTILGSLYKLVLKNEGIERAEEIARNELIQRPSLLSLDQLFQILTIKKSNKIENIELIQQTIKNSISERRFFNCNECGFKAKQFHWQCPGCNSWESLPSEPIDITLEN
ncbi:MAG: lipopolysaccharide assembly protein LapB [Nitrosomonadales bacterium]|nr:lipopolysaccharide assembly protein LapB [Nitrosomonadales bacterium]MBT4758862.1 lipopolysaccharide assembly protein LapB [Nitrosomonadales bacterium]